MLLCAIKLNAKPLIRDFLFKTDWFQKHDEWLGISPPLKIPTGIYVFIYSTYVFCGKLMEIVAYSNNNCEEKQIR